MSTTLTRLRHLTSGYYHAEKIRKTPVNKIYLKYQKYSEVNIMSMTHVYPVSIHRYDLFLLWTLNFFLISTSFCLHPCVSHHNLCHYGGTEGIFPPGLFLVLYSCCLACAKTDGATVFRVGGGFSFTVGAETRTRGVLNSYLRMLG